jgi:hypothetical protein
MTMRDEPEYLETEPIPPADGARRGPAPADGPRPAGDVRKAWMLALAADFLQWVLFPVFAAGATPLNLGVDVLVAFLITRWMGWHLAFLPAFVTELVPIANVVPSWTLAMWIVTRLRGRPDP